MCSYFTFIRRTLFYLQNLCVGLSLLLTLKIIRLLPSDDADTTSPSFALIGVINGFLMTDSVALRPLCDMWVSGGAVQTSHQSSSATFLQVQSDISQQLSSLI